MEVIAFTAKGLNFGHFTLNDRESTKKSYALLVFFIRQTIKIGQFCC